MEAGKKKLTWGIMGGRDFVLGEGDGKEKLLKLGHQPGCVNRKGVLDTHMTGV